MAYYFDQTSALGISEIILAMLNGLRLDLSATGYFLLIPGLLLTASPFLQNKIIRVGFHTYTSILLLLCSFILTLDLEMYKHWGFRLDATPLLYIGQDTTIAIDGLAITVLILMWLLIFGAFIYLYTKLIYPKLAGLKPSNWKTALIQLFLTAFLILPIRGSLGVAPINVGTVYFDNEHIFANHTAINVVWNTGYAVSKFNRLHYPENYLDKETTDKYFKELYAASGETIPLLNTSQPNVIIIILESFTYRLIEPLGGVPGVAPELSALSKEGVLFDHMYASGDRTDKGIVSVLSGYPAQPKGSIIKYPKKTQSLPYLSKKFNQMGYSSSFTYGGNINFANFRSYLSNAGFENTTHSGSFPDSLNSSKWGVHDGYVFDKFLQETNAAQKPFFKVMLTLSSHEPFDVPMETAIEGEDDISKFLNSAHYTDKCIGKFIEEAKKTDWWNNTLIVFTADHGHPMPDNQGLANPRRFKIPMIWLGGALNVKDTVISEIGSQTDIANTILAQVDKQDPEFTFSQNILDKNHHDFAVFVFNNGYGYVDEKQELIYDNTGKRYLTKEGAETEELLWPSMAFMQHLYSDYNKR
ncbi:LTA synthase family protein [Fulvivirga sediminis]|uniref:Sulfatase-like hydrolase/transferase n=1 Tax=Fulvivirga sediminis TaxID=2803949 RepID=A0A937FAH2_9BACT|nr:alkaline phosphatase family protein [Fulvivirga sediminis]MBL3657982.1 sulfatase-like hydrolase/transferase [Fulvivirga sediminis]